MPALVYSYSFMQSGSWSAFHPPQPELRQYFENCANEYGVEKQCQFNTTVREARFDEATGLWHVVAESNQPSNEKGETEKYHFVTKVLISAVGGLSVPNKCEIEGHETFEGDLFHSARWDHSVSLKNKDVVVVGNGCTASQFIPAIRGEVKSLTQFARSKHWLAPVPHNPLAAIPGWNWLVRHSSTVRSIQRVIVFMVIELSFNLCRMGRFGDLWRARWRRVCTAHVKNLAPKKYWDLLIPQGAEVTVASKRRIFDDNYLASLNAPNVELIGESLRKIGPDYVETKDGRKIHADVIILATGFATARAGAPMLTYGRKGEEQRDHWDKYGNGGPYNYRSSLLANFPNLGFLMGSNSATGHTSVIFTSETQITYLLEVFKPVLTADTPTWNAIHHVPASAPGTSEKSVTKQLTAHDRSPTAEVNQAAELNDLNWISKKMTQTVFIASGSWYKDKTSGRITAMHPTSQVAMRTRLTFPDWRELEYRNLPGAKPNQVVHTPPTAPIYKRVLGSLFGLGRVAKVLPSDPAIQYARPYTGPEALKE